MQLAEYQERSKQFVVYPGESTEAIALLHASVEFIAHAGKVAEALRMGRTVEAKTRRSLLVAAAVAIAKALHRPIDSVIPTATSNPCPDGAVMWACHAAEPAKKLARDGYSERHADTLCVCVSRALQELPGASDHRIYDAIWERASVQVSPGMAGRLYVTLGFVGEAGEWSADRRDEKEAGDLLWYASQVLSEWGLPLGLPTATTERRWATHARDVAIELPFHALNWALQTSQAESDKLAKIYAVVGRMLASIQAAGFDLEALADANYAKLSDRQNRGVLHGDGSNR